MGAYHIGLAALWQPCRKKRHAEKSIDVPETFLSTSVIAAQRPASANLPDRPGHPGLNPSLDLPIILTV
jgi:hypothetical protein